MRLWHGHHGNVYLYLVVFILTLSSLYAHASELAPLLPGVLTSISITPPNPIIIIGQQQQFTATGIYSDGSSRIVGTALTSISAGSAHTCAILSDGTVRCWGNNHYGQLGNGTHSDSSTPVSVNGINTAIAIAAGAVHSCAMLSDGTVRCWGYNGYGQLGNGIYISSNVPVSVGGINTATAIAAGAEHSCAVLSDGAMRCWGYNWNGQLGDGTNTSSNVPVSVSSINTASAITAGGAHTCAMLSDGTLGCWGKNGDGELGDGTNTSSNVPVSVSAINTASAIEAGLSHTCAVLSGGVAKCWGYNGYGQLGDGTNTRSNTPVSVSGINTAFMIAGGGYHTCAALSDGTVRCWGKNGEGELGNGMNANSNTPVSVSGINTAAVVATGDWHSCAVLSDGTVRCWGYNGYGQLGDGTTIKVNVPVDVTGIFNSAIPVQWNSSNPAAASVDSNGVAKGGISGTTDITASAAGVTGSTALRVVIADTTPPTGSVLINNNNIWTNTSAVTLTLSCLDNSNGSGCADMQISNDGIFDTELWEPFITSKAWMLRGGSGQRWVAVRYRDALGNISPKYTDWIRIDINRPVVTNVSDTPGSFHNHRGEKTTISFKVSDNLSPSCDISLNIYNSSGVLVRSLHRAWVSCPAGGAVSSVPWYGKNDSGVPVPSGKYTYKIQAHDRALNDSYIKSGEVTVQ